MVNMISVVALVGAFFILARVAKAALEALRSRPQQYDLFPHPSAQRLADRLWQQHAYVRRVERQS